MVQETERSRSSRGEKDKPDFEKITRHLIHYFEDERKIKDEIDLNRSEVRIYRSIVGIMDAIQLARETIDEENSVYHNRLKEGESLIFSQIFGQSHPTMKFFDSKKTKGRPKSDPLASQNLIFGAACQAIIANKNQRRNKIIQQIVNIVKKYPHKFEAKALENFIYRSEDSSPAARDDKKAIRSAEEVLRNIMAAASDDGAEISALEALDRALQNKHGPSDPKKF
jgi:hypothetical protein